MDHRCDLYIYDHVDGYVSVNVAANTRDIPDEELPPKVSIDEDGVDAWVERHVAVSKIVGKYETRPIAKKYAGESFAFDTPEEAVRFLGELRELGYRFPDYVIEDLMQSDEY